METYEKYLNIAKELCIPKEEVFAWCENKVQQEQERERERELSNREREERANEREIKRILAEEETKRAEFLLEAERIKAQGTSESNVRRSHQDPFTMKLPRLPMFDNNIDCLDSFLYRFELQARSYGWPEDKWSTALINCLTGEPLKVFHTLSLEEANDYKKIKDALLKRFQLTEHGFQEKFKNAKPGKGEDFSTFLNRTMQLLNRWIDLAQVKRGDFDSLYFLVLKDQIYQACNADLVSFFKERQPANVEDLKILAEKFSNAHPHKSLGRQIKSEPFYAAAASDQSYRRSDSRSRQSRYDQNYRRLDSRSRSSSRHFDQERKHYPSDRYHWTNPSSTSKSYQNNTNTRERESHSERKFESKDKLICQYCLKSGHSAKTCYEIVGRPKATPIKCQICSKSGHSADKCHRIKEFVKDTANVAMLFPDHNPITDNQAKGNVSVYCVQGMTLLSQTHESGSLKLCKAIVNGQECSALRDSGCTTIGVRKSLITDHDLTGQSVQCITFSGKVETFQLARIQIKTPYFTGEVQACVLLDPVADLIIGNIKGINDNPSNIESWSIKENFACPVQTRQMTSEKEKSLKMNAEPLVFDPADFREEQRTDPSLQAYFNLAQKKGGKSSGRFQYIIDDDLLYRVGKKGSKSFKQLVIPMSYRSKILSIGHESITAGHLGIGSTLKRISARFSWPGIAKSIREFVRSCDTCQKRVSRGRIPRVPLEETPLIEKPFSKVAIDLIGPLPKSERNNTHILTLVDYSTRWPEAIPLKSTTSTHVAEALVTIFSRLGIPDEILSDNGPQFVSDIMKEVMALMGVKQTHTTPYHPQANGLCERFNGTLKDMLRKVSSEKPREWDRYLPALLFAYREIPQETTGYAPFELLYGRLPRGPLDIIYDTCKGKTEGTEEVMFAYSYVNDLKDRIEESCRLARENISTKTTKYKHYADKKSQVRKFNVGNQVLVLLPEQKNKLTMAWKGPYEVTSVRSGVNYEIKMGSKYKTFHANMLKRYIPRPAINNMFQHAEYASCGLIIETENDEADLIHPPQDVAYGSSAVNINNDLGINKKNELANLVETFESVINDNPGHSNLLTHEIRLKTTTPINVKPYPIPFKAQEDVKKEVQNMIDLGIVRPSKSPFCSPIVVVKKKDGAIRLCIDFRKLNSVTIFDSEPIPNQDNLFSQLATASYFSKLDLAKGYWQIPLAEESKKYTAFQSPFGLLEFNYLPFGLSTAASTFQRLMRMVIGHIPNTISYFDDTCVFSSTWKEHIDTLQLVFQSLKDNGLTVKPSKTYLGYRQIDFLGHSVGDGIQRPLPSTLDRIVDLQIPKTKKDVRKLLGLLNFYRKYVPNFADLATPLTNLTKKNNPNKVQWNEKCQTSLNSIKSILNSEPLLALPNMDRTFIVRTDACNTGIAGVLLQERNGILMPCSHISRKLLDAETRYSVIEKECLAIIFSLKSFSRYLLLNKFILETDHKPLVYIRENKMNNSRLMRWSLYLQNFIFTIRHINGHENIHADLLSRLI